MDQIVDRVTKVFEPGELAQKLSEIAELRASGELAVFHGEVELSILLSGIELRWPVRGECLWDALAFAESTLRHFGSGEPDDTRVHITIRPPGLQR